MNAITATRFYIDKMVSDPQCSGMKVFLLDESTTKTVSTVYSQTQVLQRDVFLVERLEQAARHETMKHLKAVAFLRPTWANLELLKAELAAPKFSEYHVFFSNVLPGEMLNALADADEDEVVRQVQEYYADYVAVNEDLFTLNLRCSLRLSTDQRDAARVDMLNRNVSGILSVLLSLKMQPAAIRYQAASRIARQVASEVHEKIEADGIFHFKNRSSGPLLLILDRADDPVTPLLSQWTYQAMVHELLGLNNNRVKIPDKKDKTEEVVLSCTQDDFFAKHRYANFGDLGGAVKRLLDDYQSQTQMNEKISSIEDMQNFVQRYPAFRSQSLNVSKHVSLISELSRLVDVCSLMDVSQLEQEIACNDDRSAQWRELLDKLQSRAIKVPDKLRLALLYALRYEGFANLDRVKAELEDARVSPEKIALVDYVLRYGGRAVRGPGLFGSERSLMAKMTHTLKTSLEGVENVYSQHVPLLVETLDAINKSKLKDQHYPALTCVSAAKPKDVIVFIVGGVTYEEATKVAELNASNSGLKVILGGSYVHNSTSFLDDLADAYGAF
mmetsp:Transcript_7831/g.23984  ORF Transcript_7831/g.23984 Transcript_7831/m.23984 type:complete len:557 (-) Transcript_7831:420-2090(-)